MSKVDHLKTQVEESLIKLENTISATKSLLLETTMSSCANGDCEHKLAETCEAVIWDLVVRASDRLKEGIQDVGIESAKG